MQIIIPMSGFGERFRRAGYTLPKPLIEIEGKPLIGHVVDLFPNETDLIFVCNEDHLATPEYRMRETIEKYCPSGRIIGIRAHKKGPSHAVQQALHLIDMQQPVVVNYCDFTCYWDWRHFKQFVARSNCAGAIPAYRGFHPHSLGSTNYAYLREANGWVLDIREKTPFTDNRMNEFASSGTYYFASGAILADALHRSIEQQLSVNGEYYLSLAYKPLIDDGRAIAVYPLQHFMQWGTPEDVSEYNKWSQTFRGLMFEKAGLLAQGSHVVLLAGLGQRFVNEGYALPKPLIQVSGRSMVTQAALDLPNSQHQAFVLRSDMAGHKELITELKQFQPDAMIVNIPSLTEGQACSALLGLDGIANALGEAPGPITFGSCDFGMLYDSKALQGLLYDEDVDVIVWGARGYPNAARNPHMFGWIEEHDGRISQISVKSPLKSPATDSIVLGTFTFRTGSDFRRSLRRLVSRDGRVNGEFYIDSCINDAIALGLNCRLFEVESYLSWGTPNDLRTFEYWQSCFHKWPTHPYRLEGDRRIPKHSLPELEFQYQQTIPILPELRT